MAAFFLAEIESIHDEDMYAAYAMQAQLIVNKYDGETIIRTEKIIPLAEDWQIKRIIMIRFDTMEQLQRCFQSPEYLAIASWRERSTDSKALIIED